MSGKKPLYQCPYHSATFCDMEDPCKGCEQFKPDNSGQWPRITISGEVITSRPNDQELGATVREAYLKMRQDQLDESANKMRYGTGAWDGYTVMLKPRYMAKDGTIKTCCSDGTRYYAKTEDLI